MAKTIAYLRVSTADQNTEKKKNEILLNKFLLILQYSKCKFSKFGFLVALKFGKSFFLSTLFLSCFLLASVLKKHGTKMRPFNQRILVFSFLTWHCKYLH